MGMKTWAGLVGNHHDHWGPRPGWKPKDTDNEDLAKTLETAGERDYLGHNRSWDFGGVTTWLTNWDSKGMAAALDMKRGRSSGSGTDLLDDLGSLLNR